MRNLRYDELREISRRENRWGNLKNTIANSDRGEKQPVIMPDGSPAKLTQREMNDYFIRHGVRLRATDQKTYDRAVKAWSGARFIGNQPNGGTTTNS